MENNAKPTKPSQATDVSATENEAKIFVFKIEINHGHEVPIWRMVEVPATYSFYDLHVAIQDSMMWMDYHLHKFNMRNPVNKRYEHIGIPDDWMSKSIKPEKHTEIAKYFSPSNPICKYEYDFASPWNFLIRLEKIIPKDPNVKYPRCVAGNCASPPEDFTEDPSDMSWINKPIDFVNIPFRDPVEAWENAFQGF